MPTIPIQIVDVDACNNLILNVRGGFTPGMPGATVNWEITTNKVDSISIVAKAGTDDIWSTPPHQVHASPVWSGVIKSSGDGGLFAYSIIWTKGGNSHTFDPLIYIKPTKVFLPEWSVSLVASVVGFLSLGFFINWRMKRIEENLRRLNQAESNQ